MRPKEPRRPPGPLTPQDRALWSKVAATVRPISPTPIKSVVPPLAPPVMTAPQERIAAPPKPGRVPVARVTPVPPRPSADTLDGGWDRRLSRGVVAPDSTIDLHGHTLASAHAALDRGLARAVTRGDRVLLLVTGKPPRPESERPHARGAIRAAVRDWLGASPYADRIAAIRGAHPRHGGLGALYVVLRRPRENVSQKS